MPDIQITDRREEVTTSWEIAANHVRVALAARPCPHNFLGFLCLPALAGERDLLRWHDLKRCLGEGLFTVRSLRCRRLTHGQDLNRVANLEWLGQSVKTGDDGELTWRPEHIFGETDQAQESRTDDRTE